MKIYLNNAAGAPLSGNVLSAVLPLLQNHIHGIDRDKIINESRVQIAASIGAAADEIHFTAGGFGHLLSAIESSGIDHVITTADADVELLNSLRKLQKRTHIRITLLDLIDGRPDLDQLSFLLRTNTRNFVTLATANPANGNLYDINYISKLTAHYKAHLHVDANYTFGYYPINLSNIQFLSVNADAFHGPAGTGIFYSKTGVYKELPAVNLPAANIHGIAVALKNALADADENRGYITQLKDAAIYHFEEHVPDAEITGDLANGHYAWLTLHLPRMFNDQSLQQYLANQGITVAGRADAAYDTIRLSFSKLNTADELYHVLDTITSLYERVKY